MANVKISFKMKKTLSFAVNGKRFKAYAYSGSGALPSLVFNEDEEVFGKCQTNKFQEFNQQLEVEATKRFCPLEKASPADMLQKRSAFCQKAIFRAKEKGFFHTKTNIVDYIKQHLSCRNGFVEQENSRNKDFSVFINTYGEELHIERNVKDKVSEHIRLLVDVKSQKQLLTEINSVLEELDKEEDEKVVDVADKSLENLDDKSNKKTPIKKNEVISDEVISNPNGNSDTVGSTA